MTAAEIEALQRKAEAADCAAAVLAAECAGYRAALDQIQSRGHALAYQINKHPRPASRREAWACELHSIAHMAGWTRYTRGAAK